MLRSAGWRYIGRAPGLAAGRAVSKFTGTSTVAATSLETLAVPGAGRAESAAEENSIESLRFAASDSAIETGLTAAGTVRGTAPIALGKGRLEGIVPSMDRVTVPARWSHGNVRRSYRTRMPRASPGAGVLSFRARFTLERIRMITRLFAAACVLLIAGASGCSHAYESVPLSLTARGTGEVGVAVLDQRPYIHAGGKTPDFVGVQYSLEGIPFDVGTGSGRPLADSWAESVVAALRSRGFEARAVPTTTAMDRGAAARALGAAGSPGLLIGIKEWKVEARRSADLDYAITVQAVDGTGSVIAETGLGGRDYLGADFINGATFARDESLAAFRAKMEQLLNDPKIVDALGGGPAPGN